MFNNQGDPMKYVRNAWYVAGWRMAPSLTAIRLVSDRVAQRSGEGEGRPA